MMSSKVRIAARNPGPTRESGTMVGKCVRPGESAWLVSDFCTMNCLGLQECHP